VPLARTAGGRDAAAMAVSGSTTGLDPIRAAHWLRRGTWIAAALLFVWFFVRFGTRWVPAGMNTVPGLPPGAWCIVDRWSRGLRVGSDVFVDGPNGVLLSRVTALDAATVTVQHPNPNAFWSDSRTFGPLPRSSVLATVMVALPPSGSGAEHGR
jgi:hypothetical protein